MIYRRGYVLQKSIGFVSGILTLHINVTVLLDEKKHIYLCSLKRSNL